MTKTINIVILSTGLENFKEIRQALSADERTRLLAGGNDADQLYDEIVRLKPAMALITLDSNPEQSLAMIKRLATERPSMAIISAARPWLRSATMNQRSTLIARCWRWPPVAARSAKSCSASPRPAAIWANAMPPSRR